MSRRTVGQLVLGATFLAAVLSPYFFAWAMDASSTSFYIRQNIFQLGGTGTSSTFKLWNGGGQSSFGLSSSSTFQILSGSLEDFARSLRPIYTQLHFHWRNDDGTEATATSATGGAQDTGLAGIARNAAKRLRFEVSNEGGTVTGYATQQFRIEYGVESGTCAAAAYVDVGAVGGDWDMATSSQLTEGSDTTNIALGSGGVSDDNHAFLAVNGGQRESTSQTGALSVSSENFVDIEYAIQALAAASSSATYCFRVTNAGTSTDFVYTRYATATVAESNSAPAVSSVVLNHGTTPIILTPNATTSVDVNFTVTDNDGCGQVFYNGGVTTTVFRSGVTASCAASNLNCYISAATTTNNCASATTTTTTANATITLAIYYFAQPTDTSSTFSGEDWGAAVGARDSSGATSSANAVNRELATLLAIGVTPATTTYGTVPAGTNTGSTNQTTTVQNTGNTTSTLRLSGTALSLGVRTIATSSQHYATSSFTFGGTEQALSDIATLVSGFLLPAPTSTAITSAGLFWGLTIPGGSATGTYSGMNTYAPVYTP